METEQKNTDKAQLKALYDSAVKTLTGKNHVPILLLFTLIINIVHFVRYPFPARDTLTYLHILMFWNETGSFAQVLENFPKFGLLLFTFLPVKWAGMLGLPMFPVSIVWVMLMSLVSVWAFYRIILLLTGSIGRAMWCGAFLAAAPMIMQYAGNLLRDTPYLMFCLLTVLCFLYSVREKRRGMQFLSGICLAMSILSRFEAWEMLVLFPVAGIFYMIRNKFTKGEAFQFVLLALLGFSGTLILMLLGIGETAFLYEKAYTMVHSFLPEWMVQDV